MTAIIGLVLYFNFVLFQEYFSSIMWALLLSSALRSTKTSLVREIQQISHHRSSRLLPVVIKRLTGISSNNYSMHLLSFSAVILLSSIIIELAGWFLFFNILAVFLCVAILMYIFDYWIFKIYRKVVSDDTLVTLTLLVTLSFVVSMIYFTSPSLLPYL